MIIEIEIVAFENICSGVIHYWKVVGTMRMPSQIYHPPSVWEYIPYYPIILDKILDCYIRKALYMENYKQEVLKTQRIF